MKTEPLTKDERDNASQLGHKMIKFGKCKTLFRQPVDKCGETFLRLLNQVEALEEALLSVGKTLATECKEHQATRSMVETLEGDKAELTAAVLMHQTTGPTDPIILPRA